MHQVFCVLSISPRVVVSAALAAAITTAVGAQAPAPKGETFPLTVDSIMRGPDLVGYPPDGLRWSADSTEALLRLAQARRGRSLDLCRWPRRRRAGEADRRSEEASPLQPTADGTRRTSASLFIDRGRHRLLDGTGAHRQITRTTGGEANPRWARNDTAVTYVRDGNLFLVPLDTGSAPVRRWCSSSPTSRRRRPTRT